MAVDVKTQGATFEASVPQALFDTSGIGPRVPGPEIAGGTYAPSADGQKFLAAFGTPLWQGKSATIRAVSRPK